MNREPIVLETHRLTVEGKSRAGNETYFRIRELNIAFDIGRCPDLLVPVPHIFLSHAHLDHSAGLPLYAAQRGLQGMAAGSVYIPRQALDGFQQLMSLHERLEGCRYDLHLVGMEPGESVRIRRDLLVRAHEASHGVVANAYEVVELRRKLQEQWRDRTGEELAALRAAGEQLSATREHSLLFFTGDTDARLLEENDALYHSEVLIVECSFTMEGDQERARRFRHLHFDDLCAMADRFENEWILLVHFSLRDAPEEIHREIARRCPKRLRDRIRLGLPEEYSRL